MRITEGGDDTLCLSKHSIDFGPPRPSAGEGLGVRGEGASTQLELLFSVLRSQSSGVELI